MNVQKSFMNVIQILGITFNAIAGGLECPEEGRNRSNSLGFAVFSQRNGIGSRIE